MFKNGMDTLLTRDKTPTPSSWKMSLPDRCDDPDQAKKLYHDARSWVAELRGRTEPPAYPLRTLMNVVNVTDYSVKNIQRRHTLSRMRSRNWSLSPVGFLKKCKGVSAE